jgi:P27 family predicted phage terminase small subunit
MAIFLGFFEAFWRSEVVQRLALEEIFCNNSSKATFPHGGAHMASQPPEPKLKYLDGTQTNQPIQAPLPPSSLLDCPDYLDDVAKAKWPELCKLLAEAGLFSNAGRDVMAMYCTAFSQWRAANETVKKSGLIIRGLGGVCANPCVKIAADAQREMLHLAELLGLDPSGHSRVRIKRNRFPP